MTGIPGVGRGHTFTPSPDGRYVVAEVEYQFAPLRIFDLQPALDGETMNINRPISGWTADYQTSCTTTRSAGRGSSRRRTWTA